VIERYTVDKEPVAKEARMADDPLDAFDKIAGDITRTQDELAAADELRQAKAEARKRQPDDAIGAKRDPSKPPHMD
jgi:hypothetical protein